MASKKAGKQQGATKIDKGIPMPARKSGLSALIRSLEIGDSFLVGEFLDQSIRNEAVRQGFKVSICNTAEGRRVWRVE